MLEKIKKSANFIKNHTDFYPDYGIILGTGLGGLVSEIDIKHSIPYEKIPFFPISSVDGHHGRLILGNLGNKKVAAMQGRFHFYEGYSIKQVTFPVRIMKFLGIKKLIVSKLRGGICNFLITFFIKYCLFLSFSNSSQTIPIFLLFPNGTST